MCLNGITYEYIVNHMPPYDILEFFDSVYSNWPKLLFVYFPLIVCILALIKFLDYIRAGVMITQHCAKGRYYKGTIVGYTLPEDDFKECGKIPVFVYPIVKYKSKGEWYESVGHKISFQKKNSPYSVRICSDGCAYSPNAGLIVALVGVIGIIITFIAAIWVWKNSQIFLMI